MFGQTNEFPSDVFSILCLGLLHTELGLSMPASSLSSTELYMGQNFNLLSDQGPISSGTPMAVGGAAGIGGSWPSSRGTAGLTDLSSHF